MTFGGIPSPRCADWRALLVKMEKTMVRCAEVRMLLQKSRTRFVEFSVDDANHLGECAPCAELYEQFLFSQHSQEMFEMGFDYYLNAFLHNGESAFEECVPEDFRSRIRETVRTCFIN